MDGLGHQKKVWRTAVQFFSFVVFGVGALGVAFFVFPFIHLLPIQRERKTVVVQRVIHYLFRLFLGLITALGGMEFGWTNLENFPRAGAFLVVANHPTLLDVVMLVSKLPQADCVVKGDLFRNPFLFLVVKLAGYIPNTDGAAVVQEAVARIQRGRTVVVFPEGTRSDPDQMKPFELGFAHIAVRADCVVVPVHLRCRPPALSKGMGLFYVPPRKAHLQAMVGPAFPSGRYCSEGDSRFVAVRKLAKNVHQLFQENLEYVEDARCGRRT